MERYRVTPDWSAPARWQRIRIATHEPRRKAIRDPRRAATHYPASSEDIESLLCTDIFMDSASSSGQQADVPAAETNIITDSKQGSAR